MDEDTMKREFVLSSTASSNHDITHHVSRSSQPQHQLCQQRRPRNQAFNQHMFVQCMRTCAIWTQTVERRNSKCSREGPIAAPTGFALRQLDADLGSQHLRPLKQRNDFCCPLQGRPIDSA